MLGSMHSLADVVRRLWRRGARDGQGPSAKPRRLVPVLVSVLAVAGIAIGAVLATVGAKPSGVADPSAVIPQTRPAPAASAAPVVPMLGGNADGTGKPIPVLVAASTSTKSATPARAAPVSPLHGLKQADLLVVAPFSLSRQVLATVAGLTRAHGAGRLWYAGPTEDLVTATATGTITATTTTATAMRTLGLVRRSQRPGPPRNCAIP